VPGLSRALMRVYPVLEMSSRFRMIVPAMFLPAFLCISSFSTAAVLSEPVGLTAWRTGQGVHLSWSAELSGKTVIWKGTEPGKLSVLAILPGGQKGFIDLSAGKEFAYYYGLGDEKAPFADVSLPGPGKGVRILSGLVTTCSGLAPGGVFPANTQNYFSPARDTHVQFYGYYFLRPFDSKEREVRIVWKDPAGEVFCDYSHSVAPKKVDLPGEAVGQILAPLAVGLREVIGRNGQTRIPSASGLYTIETFVDDVSVSVSVFYIREEAAGAGEKK